MPPPYWGRQGGFLLCLTTSRWHKNGHLGLGDAVNSPGDPTFAPTQTQHSHRQSFQPVYCTGARMGLGVCGCVCVSCFLFSLSFGAWLAAGASALPLLGTSRPPENHLSLCQQIPSPLWP